MEKPGGERPGRGATNPGIPSKEVLRVVAPLEEAVTPYPEVCSAIRLHDVGGANRGTSEHPQLVAGSNRSSRVAPERPSPDAGAGSAPQDPDSYSAQAEAPAGRMMS